MYVVLLLGVSDFVFRLNSWFLSKSQVFHFSDSSPGSFSLCHAVYRVHRYLLYDIPCT